MTETWFSILSQLAIGLAWPAAILLLALAFRKGTKVRFNEVRKVKHPGESITMKVNDLADKDRKKPKI